MPKRTNNFQSLVKRIYDQIVLEGGTVTESAELWDEEAKKVREVDILVCHEYAGHKFRSIIECRDRARSETVEWIDGLVGKTKSLKVDKVIAVSSKGFAAAAERKAKYNNIETITMREAQERDWANFLFKPGLLLISEETFEIKEIALTAKGRASPVENMDLRSEVVIQGIAVGNLEAFINYFFREHVVPGAVAYKKEHFLEIFKTREDIEKPLLINCQKDLNGLIVLTRDGSRVEISRISFVLVETRHHEDIPQSHYLYRNQEMFSVGKLAEADGRQVNVSLMQKTVPPSISVRFSEET
jgi:hypothetical protein